MHRTDSSSLRTSTCDRPIVASVGRRKKNIPSRVLTSDPQTRFTPPLFPATTEKFFKKQENGKFNDGDYVPDPKDVESASAPSNTTDEKNSVALTSEMTMTAQEQADAEAQAKWLRPTDDQAWKKVALFFLVMYCLWVFLLTLSLMGSGFKLLGGKDSAKMFDFVDNPVSGLMIGILATVLVQSSSTTTSIIVSLVGANELSVRNAVFMIMGANIGTSVTNTIVAMGHFANADDLRRGFSAATVHDIFNLLSVLIFLPINWIYPVFEKMTYEIAKNQKGCDEDSDECTKQEFLKPYIKPYTGGVAKYNKNVAKDVSQGYCAGKCSYSLDGDAMSEISKMVCAEDANGNNDCSAVHVNYESSWMSSGDLYKKRAPGYIKTGATGGARDMAAFSYACPSGEDCTNVASVVNETTGAILITAANLAPNTVYAVCPDVDLGLCDKRLLKGGLIHDRWDMTDEGAGTFLTIIALISLCSCLFCVVYFLQIIVKGPAARMLRAVVGFNGYLNIVIGMGITILVQSSSITTSTLTPLAAVGLITLEDMLPLTLGANIGTTLTGVMAATVVTSKPVEAWQVALCHLFFNIFGIAFWYPIPRVRQVPLNGARFLGRMTGNPRYGKVFPLIYTFVVFFIIPGIAYGIAVAAAA